MTANDKQIGGEHYKGKHEVWDFITANQLDYLEGNVIKYVARNRKKNGIEDLHKALHYLEKLLEVRLAEKQVAAQNQLAATQEPTFLSEGDEWRGRGTGVANKALFERIQKA